MSIKPLLVHMGLRFLFKICLEYFYVIHGAQ